MADIKPYTFDDILNQMAKIQRIRAAETTKQPSALEAEYLKSYGREMGKSAGQKAAETPEDKMKSSVNMFKNVWAQASNVAKLSGTDAGNKFLEQVYTSMAEKMPGIREVWPSKEDLPKFLAASDQTIKVKSKLTSDDKLYGFKKGEEVVTLMDRFGEVLHMAKPAAKEPKELSPTDLLKKKVLEDKGSLEDMTPEERSLFGAYVKNNKKDVFYQFRYGVVKKDKNDNFSLIYTAPKKSQSNLSDKDHLKNSAQLQKLYRRKAKLLEDLRADKLLEEPQKEEGSPGLLDKLLSGWGLIKNPDKIEPAPSAEDSATLIDQLRSSEEFRSSPQKEAKLNELSEIIKVTDDLEKLLGRQTEPAMTPRPPLQKTFTSPIMPPTEAPPSKGRSLPQEQELSKPWKKYLK